MPPLPPKQPDDGIHGAGGDDDPNNASAGSIGSAAGGSGSSRLAALRAQMDFDASKKPSSRRAGGGHGGRRKPQSSRAVRGAASGGDGTSEKLRKIRSERTGVRPQERTGPIGGSGNGSNGGGGGGGERSPTSSASSAASTSASNASDAEVGKTKMTATQAIMRNTALDQSEKQRRIREAQRIAADPSLSNDHKVRMLQETAAAAPDGGGAKPPSPPSPSPPREDTNKALPFAPDVGEEKEEEKDYDEKEAGDDPSLANVDLTAFKSEVIQGLIKDKGMAGEEKKKRIQTAHAIMRDESLEDTQKVKRLMQVQQGKDVQVPIGDSVFAPPPAAAPEVGHGTSTPDERLRAKMAGGAAGGGGGAGVNERVNRKRASTCQDGAGTGKRCRCCRLSSARSIGWQYDCQRPPTG